MYKTILAPIDLAEIELTQKVIPTINSLAKIDYPHIHFFAVLSPMLSYYEYGLSHPERLLPSDDERIQIALAELKKAVTAFDIPEGRVHCSVEIGAPRDWILNFADEINADSDRCRFTQTKYHYLLAWHNGIIGRQVCQNLGLGGAISLLSRQPLIPRHLKLKTGGSHWLTDR